MVTYDAKSFLVYGTPILIQSAAIHYFRLPHELWRDRIVKAKRMGCNCIETYMSWNRHEPAEGQWDFRGDLDVAAYIRLCAELDMYVILRPGPYICSEWDLGGIPAWVLGKENVELRTYNEPYIEAVRGYFAEVLPQVVPLLQTNGGPIILVQNENEYFFKGRKGGREYLMEVNRILREGGVDVPIVACNHDYGHIPDTVETYNAYDLAAKLLAECREKHPDQPTLITEFWPGWFDRWGGEHSRFKMPADAARIGAEILIRGGNYSLYMFFGGSNFGFWAGRSVGHDAMFMTQSYDFDAPLSEAGGITDKYRQMKLTAQVGATFADFLRESEMVSTTGVDFHEPITTVRAKGKARLTCISRPLSHEGTEFEHEAAGRRLTVSLRDVTWALLPEAMETNGQRVDYANVTVWAGPGGALMATGDARAEAVLSVGGEEWRGTVPDGMEIVSLSIGGAPVYLMNNAVAVTAYAVDGEWILGAQFVGEDGTALVEGGREAVQIGAGGVKETESAPLAKAPEPPRLSAWQSALGPVSLLERQPWRDIEAPDLFAKLGHYYGYGIYRSTMRLSRDARLLPVGAGDRVTLFADGRRLAIFGRSEGASWGPIDVPAGDHDAMFIADHMGRFNCGYHLGLDVGMPGAPVAVEQVDVTATGRETVGALPEAVTGDWRYLSAEEATPTPFRLWRFEFTPTSERAYVDLSLARPFGHAFVDGRKVASVWHWTMPSNEGSVEGLSPGRATEIAVYTMDQPEQEVSLRIFCEAAEQPEWGQWRFLPFDEWMRSDWGGLSLSPPAYCWHRASFDAPHTDVALWARLAGMRKGQLFLNGRHIGRYWTIGPQQTYYLPEPWLRRAGNELVLLEEEGAVPTEVRLEYSRTGPFR